MGLSDCFCLGRLRFIRLPPTTLSLQRNSGKRPQSLSVELVVGITDDYGTDLAFDAVDIDLRALDSDSLEPLRDVQIQLEGFPQTPASSYQASARFTFSPVQGPVLKLAATLTFAPAFSARSMPTDLVFSLSAVPPSSEGPASDLTGSLQASPSTIWIRETILEQTQLPITTWDDRQAVLLGVRSGPVQIAFADGPTRTASDKVQTAVRTIQLPTKQPLDSSAKRGPSPTAATGDGQVAIIERPGLNNSTGQRLWDCAIGISAFLAEFPEALDPQTSLAGLPSDERDENPKKRKKEVVQRTSTPLRVVELGAGCGLASMAAAQTLSSRGDRPASVLATDVEATVETTLSENLDVNELLADAQPKRKPRDLSSRPRIRVETAVLDWGDLSDFQITLVLGPRDASRTTTPSNESGNDLTILATDVLYNTDSHGLFLSTLMSLLRPPAASASCRRALVAYKRRTEGDDEFFALASEAGLGVAKIWEWGEVSVWSLV